MYFILLYIENQDQTAQVNDFKTSVWRKGSFSKVGAFLSGRGELDCLKGEYKQKPSTLH